MEGVVLFILLVAIIIITAIIIYFVRDYIQYKTQINTQFSVTQSQVNAEKTDRLANLKYVVDQVNTVHDDIASTLNNESSTQTRLAEQLDKSQANYLSGLNTAFGFTDSTGKNVKLSNLSGTTNPNTQLLTNVIATMGLTAKDLQPNGNSVQLCSKTDPTKCIRFPDQNGNTYLTDMGNGSVVLDGQRGTTINNGINLTGGLNLNASAGSPSGAINPGPNQMVLQSSKVGVGNFASSAPNATLHVSAQNTSDNVLQLSASSGQQLLNVAPSGSINIYTNGAQVGTIEPTSTGLKITTNTLEVRGNLLVSGGTISGRLLPQSSGPA